MTGPAEKPQALVPYKTRRSKPAVLYKELPPPMQFVVNAMAFGLDQPVTVEGRAIAAGSPLSYRDAALALNYRVKRVREFAGTKLFQASLKAAMRARRENEEVNNLNTAIAIRDDTGDGSVGVKMVRLKAIDLIRGKDAAERASVQLNIQNNNSASVTPGYVVDCTEPDGQIIEHDE